MATGFAVQRRSILFDIFGSDGKSIAHSMAATTPTAYLGSTIPGFPNLVLMTGPNTGLANNSMVVMIEAQAAYAASIARHLVDHPDCAPSMSERRHSLISPLRWKNGWLNPCGRKEVVLVGIWTPKAASQRCGQVALLSFVGARVNCDSRTTSWFHGSGCLTTHSGDPIEAGETASPHNSFGQTSPSQSETLRLKWNSGNFSTA